MKPNIDNVQSLLTKKYNDQILQKRIFFNGEDVGHYITRGKRQGVVKNSTEHVVRRNPDFGFDEDLVAGNYPALERKIASAIVKHIKAGKMQMPEIKEENDDEPSGPKI